MKGLAQILKETSKGFRGLASQARRAEASLRLKRDRIKSIEEIRDIIKGLRETKAMYSRKFRGPYDDPGKYKPAYYYVEKIEEEDIVDAEDFKPKLAHECPSCHSEVPVVMSYYQTYDSPEGDTWQKKAFYICCGKVNQLKQVTRDSRF